MIPPKPPAQEAQSANLETQGAERDRRSMLELNQEYLEQKLLLLLEPKTDEDSVDQKKAAASAVQIFLASPAGEDLFKQPVDKKIQHLMDQLARKIDKDFQKQCTKHVSGDHPSKVVEALKILFINMGLRTTHTPDFSLFGGNVNIYWRKVTLESISSPTLAATITAAVLANSQLPRDIPKIPGSTVAPRKSFMSPPSRKKDNSESDGQRHGPSKGGKSKVDKGKGGKRNSQQDHSPWTQYPSKVPCKWGKTCTSNTCRFSHSKEEQHTHDSKRLKTNQGDNDIDNELYNPSESSSSNRSTPSSTQPGNSSSQNQADPNQSKQPEEPQPQTFQPKSFFRDTFNSDSEEEAEKNPLLEKDENIAAAVITFHVAWGSVKKTKERFLNWYTEYAKKVREYPTATDMTDQEKHEEMLVLNRHMAHITDMYKNFCQTLLDACAVNIDAPSNTKEIAKQQEVTQPTPPNNTQQQQAPPVVSTTEKKSAASSSTTGLSTAKAAENEVDPKKKSEEQEEEEKKKQPPANPTDTPPAPPAPKDNKGDKDDKENKENKSDSNKSNK